MSNKKPRKDKRPTHARPDIEASQTSFFTRPAWQIFLGIVGVIALISVIGVLTMWPDIRIDIGTSLVNSSFGQPDKFIVRNEGYFSAKEVAGTAIQFNLKVHGSPGLRVEGNTIGPQEIKTLDRSSPFDWIVPLFKGPIEGASVGIVVRYKAPLFRSWSFVCSTFTTRKDANDKMEWIRSETPFPCSDESWPWPRIDDTNRDVRGG